MNDNIKDEEIKEEVKEEKEESQETNEETKEDNEPVKEDSESKKEKKNKLKEENEKLKEEVLGLKDQLLRNRAELENFKKRLNEERITDRKYASMGLIDELVNHLDTLKRTVNMTTDNEILKNFLIGFKMINDQIFDVLKNDGLKEIEALNLPFDPAFHQAVEKEKQDGVEPGIVIAELQKGYMYKDRVLRPTMVKVSE